MSTTNQHLAARARTLREAAGVTQGAVVEKAVEMGHSLTVPTLSTLETGKRGWNARYIDAVACGLGLTPQAFLAAEQPRGARREQLAQVVVEAVNALVDALRPPQVG